MGMMALVNRLLVEAGVNPERFSLKWASAAEAPRFVKLISAFTEKIRSLGPLGEAEGIDPAEIESRLAKALTAAGSRKLRIAFGNAAKTVRSDAIFTQEHINAVIAEKMDKSISAAFAPEDSGKTPAAAGEKTAAPAPAEPLPVKREALAVKSGKAPGEPAVIKKKEAVAAKKPAAKKKTASKKKK